MIIEAKKYFQRAINMAIALGMLGMASGCGNRPENQLGSDVVASTTDGLLFLHPNGTGTLHNQLNCMTWGLDVNESDGIIFSGICNTPLGTSYDLFAYNPHTFALTQLTESDEVNEHFPQWNPQSTHIAYTRGSDIYSMRIDGQDVRQLTDEGTNFRPTWSQDGSQIAYISSNGEVSEVYIMDLFGENKIQITNLNMITANNLQWSPDGTKLAFTGNSDHGSGLFIWNLGDGSYTLINGQIGHSLNWYEGNILYSDGAQVKSFSLTTLQSTLVALSVSEINFFTIDQTPYISGNDGVKSTEQARSDNKETKQNKLNRSELKSYGDNED